ncbi:MAG: acetate--CoA ligase, partial [Myxococcales bacterium]|nr:acetate--CoA ligase [Myxococcales bacterium]
MSEGTIQSVSTEERRFDPPADFAAKARIGSLEEYQRLYDRSIQDPNGFWREQAENLHWFKEPEKTYEWKPPFAKWFLGGKTNLAYNCLDRHLEGPRADATAILWEGEPGETRTITYRELHGEVCRMANVLKDMGVGEGDRVGIYMGMVPEAAMAMLACARVGAIHTVIFGGFAADAIRDRLNDAEAKAVITQDGAWRRGQVVPLKAQVDKALAEVPSVKKCLVIQRTKNDITMESGRDVYWHEARGEASAEHRAAELDSEHPLFILYTSGTTGKPKGVLHTTGGYMVGTWLTTRTVFDLQDDDLYWCTADVGWITGHSYVVYGPLTNGASVFMYEGAPNHPDPARMWQLIEKHKITIYYTAPTAIRACIRWGNAYPEAHDLTSLRLLGTVGEPINPEAWMWYRKTIGGDRCPIVDTWWQTE